MYNDVHNNHNLILGTYNIYYDISYIHGHMYVHRIPTINDPMTKGRRCPLDDPQRLRCENN